jgi:hypothetical protein
MSANVLLRVPGAAVSVDPTPRTRPRHPLRKPRTLTLSPHPPAAFRNAAPFERNGGPSTLLGASNHDDASKRGEPLREGRLWRSRRKAGRSTVERRWVDTVSRAGYPLADVVLRHRSPERSGSPRFENEDETNYLPRSRTTTAPLPPACRGASQYASTSSTRASHRRTLPFSTGSRFGDVRPLP